MVIACPPLSTLHASHSCSCHSPRSHATRLRTLLTRPLDATGRLPALLLADWTSCDGTEVPERLQRGWINLVRGIVQTPGLMVLRVDKPGTGDSEGSCADLDFDGTVAYLRDALVQLKAHPDVDPQRIVVFGESVGAYMAPLVARGLGTAGIVAFGGVAPTWFERMLTFERKQRALGARPTGPRSGEMARVATFLQEYLIRERPLERIFQQHPALRETWRSEISHRSATRHYGRPVRFHQQAQRHDFVRAFIDADAPVLLLMGEWDQFESVEATQAVVQLVNRARAGHAALRTYPRMNHQVEFYDSPEAAMSGEERRGIGASAVVDDVRAWLRDLAPR